MKNSIYLAIILVLSLFTNLLAEESIFEFKADKINYDKNKNQITAEGNAVIYNSIGKKIFADKIFYDRNKNTIRTFSDTQFLDENGNKISTKNLFYNVDKNELSTNNEVKIIDNKKNVYKFKKVFYNTKTQKGFGESFFGNYVDGSKLRSNKISFNLFNGTSTLSDSDYTNCDNIYKNNNYCPWWSLKTSKTEHDKNKKVFKHKNAVLKIRNIPILYLPYLEHPDPTVKRKTGLLPPLFKNLSSTGRTLHLPYFWSIDQSQDLTITPVYYLKEYPLILTEFRKKFKKSYLIIDSSYTQGYKNLDKVGRNKGSRNHLFTKYTSSFQNKFFKNNQLNFQIQKVSQENYLKVNQINTSLAKEDDNQLENHLELLSYNDKSSLEISAKIFEDLNKHKNDKYEYVFPSGSFTHNLTRYNQNINFKSNFIGKRFGDNEEKTELINYLSTTSKLKKNNFLGTGHYMKTRITNINTYDKNNSKNDSSSNNYFTIAFDNSLPLYKKKNNSFYLITPKIFTKYTTGTMSNDINRDKNLVYADTYSMDRSSNLTNPETGLSFGIGVDVEKNTKNENNEIYLKNLFGIGQVFRTNKMDQMPIKSSLNNKQSNFAGYYNLSFLGKNKQNKENKINFISQFNQNKIDLKYNFNLDKSLSRFDQNKLELNFVGFNKINGIVNFDEKNKYTGNERKINYEVNFKLNQNFYLTSSIIDDLKNNLKESEKIGLMFENDCIKIGLNFKKEFYSNSELSTNNSIFLSFIIKPFANDFSQDLSSFVK